MFEGLHLKKEEHHIKMGSMEKLATSKHKHGKTNIKLTLFHTICISRIPSEKGNLTVRNSIVDTGHIEKYLMFDGISRGKDNAKAKKMI